MPRKIRTVALALAILIIVAAGILFAQFGWLIHAWRTQDSAAVAVRLLYLLSETEARDVALTAAHFDVGPNGHPAHDSRQRIEAAQGAAHQGLVGRVVYIGFRGQALEDTGKDFGCFIHQYRLQARGDLRRLDPGSWRYRLVASLVDLRPIATPGRIAMNGRHYPYEPILFDVKTGTVENAVCPEGPAAPEVNGAPGDNAVRQTAIFP